VLGVQFQSPPKRLLGLAVPLQEVQQDSKAVPYIYVLGFQF
jgi:hypothetical protein